MAGQKKKVKRKKKVEEDIEIQCNAVKKKNVELRQTSFILLKL